MISERFTRVELMLGKDNFEKINTASVTIVGLGAVGGYALEGLVRAGVGNIRIIDFDVISPSNINRQLLALETTLGRPKCEVARERVLNINPDCNVEAINAFVDYDNTLNLIGESPNLVIDAIDSLNPKVDLLTAAREAKIPLISSLGAAMRFDTSKIQTGLLEEVHHCPLGRAVRKRLRRRNIPLDFMCVYSAEELPNPMPIALPDESLSEDHYYERGRTRNTLGSLPTITGIFGLTAANLAIKMIVGD